MKKILTHILILSTAILGVILSACSSVTTADTDAPREMICELRYAGSTYKPMQEAQPYNFALYDVNGKFIAYLDTSRLVLPSMETYMGQFVVVRGAVVKIDSINVCRADTIRRQR